MTNVSIMKKAWSKAKKNIFRLEILPEYKVPEDLVLFEKWKNNDFNVKPKNDDWLNYISTTKKIGLKIQRVRITPLPIPEYIQYEIDYWKYSSQVGEEIYFLEEDIFKRIQKKSNFNIEDYWIFDDKVLVIFHYEKGDLIEERFIDNKCLIDKHKKIKSLVLKQAVPMKEFLHNNKQATKNIV